MKSRTSYFDKTILRKDLTRFSPLWALYLIGGLLIMHLVSGFFGSYYNGREHSIATALDQMIGPMGILSAGYGFLAAQLLFGDLHNTRLCYGVHAFPLRREGWYLTHVTSGLLMGLVPPLVIVLTLMPMMGKFWFTGLLCWGGMALHYLFFFGLAVFCMMCTGNRFASAAVYGILNFLSMIIQWFSQTIYIPLLPGVRGNTQIFNRFCPVVELVKRDDFFPIEHLESCFCYQTPNFYPAPGSTGNGHEYAFTGLGSHWGYLWVLAAVGIALLAGALLLYRIRHLERAGDFMAFKPMKPMFLTVYTLCVGALLFIFGEAFGDEFTGYLFFAIGILIGYFTGKMLLERTIRVFNGKGWAGLGILYAAVIFSLLLTWIDPIGISRRIPKAEKVEAVYLYDGRLSDYQINNLNLTHIYNNIIPITDPEDIADIRETHRLLLKAHNPNGSGNGYCPVTIQYVMKNGTRITRTYDVSYKDDAYRQILDYLRRPESLFGVPSPEKLQGEVTHIYSEEFGEIPAQLWPELLKAMWLDAEQGYLSSNSASVPGNRIMYMELRLKDQYRAVFFSENAPHLNQWLNQYRNSPVLLLQHDSLEKLVESAKIVYCRDYDLQLNKYQCEDFFELLWQDCKNGLVSTSGKWGSGLFVEVETERTYLTLYLSPKCESAKWLQNYAE